MTTDERAAVVQSVLTIPLHRALGVTLVAPDIPSAGVELHVGELACNPFGSLHGGLVPLFLDVACLLAVLPQLETNTHAVTVQVAASLLVGVPLGATVQFSGSVTRKGRSLVFLTAQAMHEGRVVATGQLVKSIVNIGGTAPVS